MFVYFGLNIFPRASGVCDSFQPQYHGVALHGSTSAEAGWHKCPFIERGSSGKAMGIRWEDLLSLFIAKQPYKRQ